MNKTKIIGTGLNGMVGSRIVEMLSHEYEFENMSRSEGTDITDFTAVHERLSNSSASIVIHLAAKADVDACENDKAQGTDGEAWKVNVEATKNIAEVCKKLGKKIIYFSTDFVFDGENPPEEGYTEESVPNPTGWYATTKYEGEKAVKATSVESMIVRIAFPFRSNFAKKKDFVRAIIERLQNSQPIAAISDQIITPTFIDDITEAMRILIDKNQQGVYHVVGSQSLSPYNCALRIAEIFDFDKQLLSKTTGDEFFKGRADRPFHLAISNAKIGKLGIGMRTFEESLQELKAQMSKI